MPESPLYGESRARAANVSYAEIERCALEILASGRRPAVETVRARLGRGSPATIAAYLKRFWRDLGVRAQGDPAALTRLPAEIIEAVDGIWQRALALAAQSAKSEDNAARARLEQLKIEQDVRSQSFELRERAYETGARERERALADSRDHLLSTLRMLEADRATLKARELRITELEGAIEAHRRQLARLVARSVAKNRALIERPSRSTVEARPARTAKRRRGPKKTRRPAKFNFRSKR